MWSLIARRFSSLKNVRNYSDGAPPMRLLRNYEKFQKDDAVPVYLKGGVKDRILVGLTMVLIVIGMGDGLFTIFQMAKPKKN